MPTTKTQYDVGDIITYSASVPLSQRDIIADGYILDKIYIVTLTGDGEAIVRWSYPGTGIFTYDEEIPNNHHVIQALRNTKNKKMSYRLITGTTPVYGRVIFKSDRGSRIINVRSVTQYERYLKAIEIVNENSPGPHRLVGKEKLETGMLYNFRTLNGNNRSVEFVKEKITPTRKSSTK